MEVIALNEIKNANIYMENMYLTLFQADAVLLRNLISCLQKYLFVNWR